MPSGYSVLEYQGDGVTTVFAVNFTLGYLKKSDIYCRVGDEVDGSGNPAYRVLEDIPGDPGRMRVLGAVPTASQKVLFRRITSKTVLQNDYADGEALDDDALDNSFKQALMIAHELLDGFGLSTVYSDIDLTQHKIVNVVTDPNDPTSLCNVGYAGQAPVHSAAALASATASAASSNSASAAAAQSAVYAQQAATLAGALPAATTIGEGKSIVSAAGSWVSALFSKEADGEANFVTSYGAVGDGVTDNTAALIAALLVGKPLFVPAGLFVVNGDFVVVEKTVVIRGCGIRVSMFLWPNADGGIYIQQNKLTAATAESVYAYKRTYIRDISLLSGTNAPLAKYPLWIEGNPLFVNYGRNQQTVEIARVEISGLDPRLHGWLKGFRFDDTNHVKLISPHITGWQNGLTGADKDKNIYEYSRYFNMDVAIEFNSTGIYEVNGLIVDDARVKNVRDAVRQLGPGEGLTVKSSIFTLCYNGVWRDRTRNAAEIAAGVAQSRDPLVAIVDTHINAVHIAVYCKYVQQIHIGGTLFYTFPFVESQVGETIPGWVGIYLDNCAYSVIDTPQFEAFPHVFDDDWLNSDLYASTVYAYENLSTLGKSVLASGDDPAGGPAPDGVDDFAFTNRSDGTTAIVLDNCTGVRVIGATMLKVQRAVVLKGSTTMCEVSGTRNGPFTMYNASTMPYVYSSKTYVEGPATARNNYIGPVISTNSALITPNNVTPYAEYSFGAVNVDAGVRYRFKVNAGVLCTGSAGILRAEVTSVSPGVDVNGDPFQAIPVTLYSRPVGTQVLPTGVAQAQDFIYEVDLEFGSSGAALLSCSLRALQGTLSIPAGGLYAMLEKV